jgi:Fic family protein
MDMNLVRKVMTFKSGRFVFSASYNTAELAYLLFEARLLYRTIADLPVLPEWSAYLEKELIRRSIFSTAALEGNPLKEEEVGKIIEQANDNPKSLEAEKAIRNLANVYKGIKTIDQTTGPFTFTETFIKEMHSIITTGLENPDNLPGGYRNHTVKVGDKEHGGIYTPPKCQPDIVHLMKEFIAWINSKDILELDGLIRAALAHYHLGLIHPFGNGNGRTIRVIEALLVRTSGIKYVPIMLSNYYYRHIDEYYLAFSNTRKDADHDVTIFLKFMLAGVIDSLNEIKDNVTHNIRKLVMRDYCVFLRAKKTITQRQHDLLEILMDRGGTISLNDLFKVPPYQALYRNVSERTARRDIARLSDLKLLSPHNGGYELELRVLD